MALFFDLLSARPQPPLDLTDQERRLLKHADQLLLDLLGGGQGAAVVGDEGFFLAPGEEHFAARLAVAIGSGVCHGCVLA